MRIVKSPAIKMPRSKKAKSPVLTDEFWRDWRLEFIASHNEKIRRKKRKV